MQKLKIVNIYDGKKTSPKKADVFSNTLKREFVQGGFSGDLN